jgi:photosystem II stability/assembly factor-like uncharacterized protein
MRYFKLFLFLLILSGALYAQWYERSNGLPQFYFSYAIDAVDSLVATGIFSITENHIPDSIYLTINGGDLWYARALPNDLIAYEYLYDVSITDENKIWFCTGEGKIFNTTDGGNSWQLQFDDTSKTKFMNYIEMFDSLNGIAMGDAPSINEPALFLKTTNGGISWVSQNQLYFIGESNSNIWRTVDFVNMSTGYFILSDGQLYKTTNGGVFWLNISNLNMRVLKAFNGNILLGVDQYILHRTTNGGLSWESYQSNLLNFGYDIEFLPGDPSKVWYTSSRACFSTDYGTTWVEEFNLDNYNFMDIVFKDENSGWLIVSSNVPPYPVRIFRTTNGGFGGLVSVDGMENTVTDLQYGLKQNYPNPFNPSTKIKYSVPQTSNVELKIFDIIGDEIETFVNEVKPAGTYELTWYAEQLPSGIYFYQLRAGSFVETKKMVIIK